MPFIDPNERAPDAILIGERDGTKAIYLVRQTAPAGYYAGLHYHHGDEAIRVVSGGIRCRIGEETRVCGPGTILVIPPKVEHGFIVLVDSVLETFGQRKVGSYTIVLGPGRETPRGGDLRTGAPVASRPAGGEGAHDA